MHRFFILLTPLLFLACGKGEESHHGPSTAIVDTSVVDEDQDGIPENEDCDDTDVDLGAIAEDGDCDGALTAEDCDDADAESTVIAEDADCDGVLTPDDCDDEDSESTVMADDTDCDGVVAADDCDDEDSESTVVADDADCDGTLTAEDCDDNDSSLNGLDEDEDGYSTCDEDCDDGESSVNPGAADGLISDRDCDASPSVAGLSGADYSFHGEAYFDNAGMGVSSAGDVDGDGLDDLLIGAPYYEAELEDAGAAYIILGKNLGSESSLDLANSDYILLGDAPQGFAGYTLSGAGDVDGDGLDDLLVGAYNADALQYSGNDRGAAYLILGKSLGSESVIELGDADYIFSGVDGGDWAGCSVAGVGDLDSDGLDDILIGADHHSNEQGTAYLFFGSSLGTISEIDLRYADHRFNGEQNNDFAGTSVSSAGDVDGDGLPDILIGAHPRTEADRIGAVYIVLGSTIAVSSTIVSLGNDSDYKLIGAQAQDYTGWSTAGVGDVDGDGLDDVLVGAYHTDTNNGSSTGVTYLLMGSSLGSDKSIELSGSSDYVFVGEGTYDLSGVAIDGAGDVDGDGLSDILIGALYYDEEGERPGAAYVILGASLGSESTIELADADFKLLGEVSDGRAGRAVSTAGDVNNDGLSDILVGAPTTGEDLEGRAYLILSGL